VRFFLTVLTVMLVPLAAQAQMLKCISKDGKVEYAAQCPTGTKEQQTGIKSTPGAASSASPAKDQAKGKDAKDSGKPKSLAEQEADFKKRKGEQAEAEAKQKKEAAEADQRKRACQDARSYLAGLESGARITRNDPNTGERTFLDDTARAQEAERARQSVQANCK
jgi:hypothetical protein